VLILVIVLVVVAGAGTWLLTRPENAAAAQTVTSTVSQGTYQQTVSATGNLAPTKQADLAFAVSGRVTSVRVAEGDAVHEGDPLASLDLTSIQAALDSAQAQLDAAQAQYDDDVNGNASVTQLSSDSASVAAAESSVSQAQDNLHAATLQSTLSGIIASLDLSVGDQVSGTTSSSSSGGGGSDSSNPPSSSASGTSSDTSSTSQVVVVKPNYFKVVANVSADDVASVKEGLQAQVTPSGSSLPVYGTVTSVGLVAETSSSGAATFPVTVTLTGPHPHLYAGTSATVSIITRQVSNVLAVPAVALHTSGSMTYVEKLVNGKQVRTTVNVGETYGPNTEVTSGLKAGDKVVLVTLPPPTGSGNNRGGTNGLPGGANFPRGGGLTGGPPGGFSGGGQP
jgi:macrolide-specific efflux system membrane fusion protein